MQIKLFYRPASLLRDAAESGCGLKISQSGHRLKVENPSPYFVTFAYLKSSTENIPLGLDNLMIAPRSHQEYPLKQPRQQIEWQLINDYGGLSPVCRQ